MLIDSHCHLPSAPSEVEKTLSRAHESGVTKMINIGTSLENNVKVSASANDFDSVYAAIGVYPNNNQELSLTNIIASLEKQLTLSKKIVAIGECGVDITQWGGQRPIDKQIELFEAQIDLAQRHDLPVIIHNRNGDEKVLEMINAYSNVQFIAHCFFGDWGFAKKLLDLNVVLSFSGFITHSSKSFLLETVEKVPDNSYIIETDAPYILPKGLPTHDKKGESLQNEPANVRMVAQKIAEVRGKSFEEVASQTYATTCQAFKI